MDDNEWLDDFGRHQRAVDRVVVYWLSVPMLILGTVGLLWTLPVPEAFRDISPALNWGTAFLLAAVVYYFIISLPLAFGMLPFVMLIAAFNLWLQWSSYSGLYASMGFTAAGLFGFSASRFRRGGFSAVASDVQRLMIAPLWLLSRLYRRMGIPH
ncbi:MAG: hypothetical protein R3315_04875 [Woeseiaceae bacterium]|nr:hypothetical protein [Woeseiaceae bacterium]